MEGIKMTKKKYPRIYEKFIPIALFFLVILAIALLFFAITVITGSL